jgi:hypothetical protein
MPEARGVMISITWSAGFVKGGQGKPAFAKTETAAAGEPWNTMLPACRELEQQGGANGANGAGCCIIAWAQRVGEWFDGAGAAAACRLLAEACIL